MGSGRGGGNPPIGAPGGALESENPSASGGVKSERESRIWLVVMTCGLSSGDAEANDAHRRGRLHDDVGANNERDATGALR